jgi:hypothetical protein
MPLDGPADHLDKPCRRKRAAHKESLTYRADACICIQQDFQAVK